MLDEEEVTEFYEPEVGDDEDAEHGENGEDGDNVIVSGDPSAAANALKGHEKSMKDKKIAEAERTTTPYMTKYERARILGTRALQIRYGGSCGVLFGTLRLIPGPQHECACVGGS
jgi:DNA-directed RNA polymerase I, II, and III subunit RPABC2